MLGLVGESGCGKSITALSIMRLVSDPGRIVGGSVLFKGKELLEASENDMRDLRGNDIAMIFQDPMTSLNPVYKVGEQIAEALRLHRKLSKEGAWEAAIKSMREVAIPSPERRVHDYPHQLSGGMRQRGHDSHGTRVRSRFVECGRAYNCFRRHHSGSDPGASERSTTDS